jgi:hypothetical protein
MVSTLHASAISINLSVFNKHAHNGGRYEMHICISLEVEMGGIREKYSVKQ